MPDNWKHRSENMRCKTCMCFVLKATLAQENPVLPTPYVGRCRRHAPTLGGWPTVFTNDWCYDHKLDENKYSPETSCPT